MIQLIIQCDFEYLQLYFYMSELIFLYNNAVQKSMYGSALINLCILKCAFLDLKMAEVHFLGEIASGYNFPENKLMVRFKIKAGSGWKLITG